MRGLAVVVFAGAANVCVEVIAANKRTQRTNAPIVSIRTRFLFIDIFSFTIDNLESVMLLLL
jgi:hypothetical protein